ncbi:pyridoxamine 5'-phosphate oxidase family protein [Alteribacter natronophilus]|uniref:pyridoxamine 5'-phosphate oxidase family protein n=1 Tax=Alteribacter natronophilus TaxID=2583810 RepID=UPI00110F5A15|nr:pyridoxamine 5'-phosphate oxidase family protein [Alteribacter natronophilus]TMW71122.1 pyridoxamine 5'-phosphate oxidase family protein [Alteribacter natronophilus]
MPFSNRLTSKEQLAALAGEPSELVKRKTIDHLDRHCRTFIRHSPFAVISTSDGNGFCDASPRGDGPGFVRILDDKRLIIPERPGNKRMDTLYNLLESDRIGLLFLIPGFGETLRVNGRGSVITDRKLLEPLAVRGKIPALGIGVEADECFIHCAKAMKRSGIWKPDQWPETDGLPKAAEMLADHAGMNRKDTGKLHDRLEKGYRERLY